MSRKNETCYRTFEVSLGWCAAATGAKGICALILPVGDDEAAEALIRDRAPDARRAPSALRTLVSSIRRYFEGWRTDFSEFCLDLSCGTALQQRVWGIVRSIPYGQVRTYRRIGMEIGRPSAVRAIGNAVGANPVPLLVPCHRVVRSDGMLGGFSAQGGLALKARMLELERVSLFGSGGKQRVPAAIAC